MKHFQMKITSDIKYRERLTPQGFVSSGLYLCTHTVWQICMRLSCSICFKSDFIKRLTMCTLCTTNIRILSTPIYKQNIIWFPTCHHCYLLRGMYAKDSKDVVQYWHYQLNWRRQCMHSKCLSCNSHASDRSKGRHFHLKVWLSTRSIVVHVSIH